MISGPGPIFNRGEFRSVLETEPVSSLVGPFFSRACFFNCFFSCFCINLVLIASSFLDLASISFCSLSFFLSNFCCSLDRCQNLLFARSCLVVVCILAATALRSGFVEEGEEGGSTTSSSSLCPGINSGLSNFQSCQSNTSAVRRTDILREEMWVEGAPE